ncbi:dual specificity protein phosphatase family protein [Synechococcus sp. EJ6-Ellesmere]|uniref:protein-tyrosine phosphatase family protein n=1 Tax=Synechococcus sp. EJ6-Ellesmere TaxID=2823734 RepID=UPI0020CC72C7|nr:dual specificity protein phosphatase [Synechococcus sp. EJ6-Ellesmere]MCP9826606.1 dual specificity protein phosphatase family protein [Synechococcus sp. EJ6-Ellesmere]
MRITWLLSDELAVGTAPCSSEDLDWLEQEGVRSLISLCSAEEAPLPGGIAERFQWVRLPLPDHRHQHSAPTGEQIATVLSELSRLRGHGPVFLHCVAGVERSPLVAMAWLIQSRRMGWQAALDYVQQTHPGTSPLPEQLAVLRSLPFLTAAACPQLPAVA